MAAGAGEPVLCDFGRAFGGRGPEPSRIPWAPRTADARASDSVTMSGVDPAAQPEPMPS